MKVIYMKKFRELRHWIRHGSPPFEGYTFDVDEFEPITEEDFESVTVLNSPGVIGDRSRWRSRKINRKVTGKIDRKANGY